MPKRAIRVSVKVIDLPEVRSAIKEAHERGYQLGLKTGMRNAGVLMDEWLREVRRETPTGEG